MVAYSYQQNLFPIFEELRVKTPQQYNKVAFAGLSLTACLYFSVALVSIFMFGDCLQSSVLINIGAETPANWESYVVRVAFMIVLACHIPFIFYMGKEGLLIMVDEHMRQSISSALVLKLQANQTYSMKDGAITEPPNPNLPIPSIDETGNPCRMSYNELVTEEIRKSQALKTNNDNDSMASNESATQNAKLKTKNMMSVVSTAKAQKLAYKTMNPILYVVCTMACYGVIVVASCFLKSITNIFDFASAIAISCLAFLFPACFYLMAKK